MGNCNFKAEKDKDSVSGKYNIHTINNIFILYYSLNEEPFLIPVRNRKRRIWKGVEG